MNSVDRCEFIIKIGRGGVGIVYLGRDPYIKRLVAIKIAQAFGVPVEDIFQIDEDEDLLHSG